MSRSNPVSTISPRITSTLGASFALPQTLVCIWHYAPFWSGFHCPGCHGEDRGKKRFRAHAAPLRIRSASSRPARQ
jgi:hypothetical protein